MAKDFSDRKELTEIQHFAIQAAREKFLDAQIFLNRIVSIVMKELSIEEAEIADWQFTEGFKFAEKKKAAMTMPEMKIPKEG